MDATDFRIYVELFPDRRLTMRGLDPRLSAEAIAQKIGLGRSAVRERLAAWERSGFLTGKHVIPNVALLGARFEGINIRVPDPREKAAVVAALPGIEGAFGALEYVGEWIGGIFALMPHERVEDKAKEVAGLPGVAQAEPFRMFDAPACAHAPSSLDWRITRAFREDSSRTLDEVARAVGVSTRTVRRRYERLLDADAVWFFPTVDFRHVHGAVVRVNLWLLPGARRQAVVARFRKAFPDVLETAMSPGIVGEPVLALMHFPSVAAVEEARGLLAALEGVEEVEVLYPVRTLIFAPWVERRLTAVAPPA